MADEVEITAATGTPQLLDAREVTYSGPVVRKRAVVTLDMSGADPTFFCSTANLTSTASRFQFVLYNGSSTAVVRIKRILLIPVSAATVTTPVHSGPWTMSLRIGPTTNPSGSTLTISSVDSADTLPASISAHSAPSTSPAGGTVLEFYPLRPSPAQLILTTASSNATSNALSTRLGFVLYSHDELDYSKPLTLRQDQCIEIQQDGTAGTMTVYRLHCVFTAF